MYKRQTFLRIIFPQVFKRIVPALGNEVIVLVKDTSLAFTIGVAEMFTTARAIVSAQGTLTAFVVAALFYCCLLYTSTVNLVEGVRFITCLALKRKSLHVRSQEACPKKTRRFRTRRQLP